MQRNAVHAIARKSPAALEPPHHADAFAAFTLITKLSAVLGATVHRRVIHVHRLSLLALIEGALPAVVIDVGALLELEQIAVAVAPELLAVPEHLRCKRPKQLDLQTAEAVVAGRRPAAGMASLRTIGRRLALAP
jgi:hypothetical protein